MESFLKQKNGTALSLKEGCQGGLLEVLLLFPDDTHRMD